MKVRLPYPPSGNNFYSVFRGRKIISEDGRDYQNRASVAIELSNPQAVGGEVRVTLWAFRPRKSGDIDNIIKPVLDSLTKAGVYADDRFIIELHVYRRDDKDDPRVEVEVEAV